VGGPRSAPASTATTPPSPAPVAMSEGESGAQEHLRRPRQAHCRLQPPPESEAQHRPRQRQPHFQRRPHPSPRHPNPGIHPPAISWDIQRRAGQVERAIKARRDRPVRDNRVPQRTVQAGGTAVSTATVRTACVAHGTAGVRTAASGAQRADSGVWGGLEPPPQPNDASPITKVVADAQRMLFMVTLLWAAK